MRPGGFGEACENGAAAMRHGCGIGAVMGVVWVRNVGDMPVAINPVTGLISSTSAADQVGTQVVLLRVTDAQGDSIFQDFAVDVLSASENQQPTITSTPQLQRREREDGMNLLSAWFMPGRVCCANIFPAAGPGR